ncbi:MAG: orotate phosphoribosyltransferase [Gemmatimonadota bacterium]
MSKDELESRQRLCRLFAERSFREGDFVLASGKHSRFYVDCRTTTMQAEGQALVGAVGLDTLLAADLTPDLVGGLTMGADPISYAIAGESWRRGRPVNAFSVRKQAKQHGRGRRIEGCFEPGQTVVVIEDVITSGGSALEACAAVREAGAEILAVLAAIDRQEGGRERIESEGLTVHSLFTIEDLRAC